MSAFTHGFNLGFFHGMFNNTFGGFYGACNPFMCWNSTPMFFTPSYNFGGFYQYQTPMPNLSTPLFTFSSSNFNTAPTFGISPQLNYSWQNSVAKTNDFTTDWGDMFVKSSSAKKTEKKPSAKKYSDSDTSSYTYDAECLKKKWNKKKSGLSQEFYNKVVQVSKRLNCNPNDLMGLMYSESSLDPSKENKIGAVGLIQFLPKTVKGTLKTVTSEELKAMSAEEQMVYVEKYLVEAKRTAGYSDNEKIGPGTLYALTYLPGYAKNDILSDRNNNETKKYYAGNEGLDLDSDGKITKAELAKRIQDKSA